ncbi:transglutaminase-like domain-containing protein [Brevibacillus sp. SYSU BS000544]|uniref:transglutaminase-like domain-containing protein n=1 Tax=Brevibacillus sp. SYSU BS000544 TaxID=3416443 RepID=UPI003CE4CB11
MKQYLNETPILDFNAPAIHKLVIEKGWKKLSTEEKIKQIYHFVKDDIKFGYNASDDLTASEILADGYGQCNTKATLFMALLRAVDIPCRFHGFTIYKELQKGALTPLAYHLAPDEIIHSWVEVYFEDKWIFLEGLILDAEYLTSIQRTVDDCTTSFCGYGIATENLQDPGVEWTGGNTFIQSKGIAKDFGLFNSPDDFYKRHGANAKGLKKVLYSYFIRHSINKNVEKVRKAGLPQGR